ncbi:MAG: VCBS repeat-containing protein [Verrucomicrobia bacterium]|nr:VCBS repeat-containing protein [Verrucomicrobiota bacterium]
MISNAVRYSFLGLLSTLQCAAAPEPGIPNFRAVEIDTKVQIGYGLAIADVDGDKKPDILLADKNLIVWYQNPSWQKHVIAEKLTARDHVCIAAADADGDGKAEVAVGAEWNPGDTRNSGAVFYLIPPADRTQKWEPVKLPHEPTVHRMRWAKDWMGRVTLVVAPLHGRGNDPGKGEGAGVKIQRYIRPDNPRDPWEVTTIDESLHKTHNFDPVQWDDDEAMEFLIGGKEGLFLSNWSREDNALKLTQLGSDAGGGAGEVRAGRLARPNDFLATVEPMHGNQLVLYRPSPAGQANSLWARRVLDETIVDGHALACGDLLGIGRDQIVVGWRAMNRPGVKVGIKMFSPLDAEGKEWKQTLIDDNTMACEDLTLADLNGDNRLDIVAAGRATKNLKIYFNEAPK